MKTRRAAFVGIVTGSLGLAVVSAGCGGGARAAEGPAEPMATDPAPDPGLRRLASELEFDEVIARAERAIAGRGLVLMTRVDHGSNADAHGLPLRPTVVLVFGDPRVGTPLMHDAPTAAIDLPQKLLVVMLEGRTHVFWNDPRWLARRHGLDEDAERITRVARALEGVANEAAGIGEETGDP